MLSQIAAIHDYEERGLRVGKRKSQSARRTVGEKRVRVDTGFELSGQGG